jgi:hypothetical protein
MRLNQIQFGSLLAYCPSAGYSDEIDESRKNMRALKSDSYVEEPPIPFSEWTARTMQERGSSLPFLSIFQPSSILVPLPRSSLLRPDSLWVPDRIAQALVRRGIGARVARYLIRTTAVPKSAFSPPDQRPSPEMHYNSMTVEGSLESANDLVLVDDIITRGHTILGAANRLLDAFPASRITAFAAMRAISNPLEFRRIYDPCIGTITYRQDHDDAIRTP